MTHERSPGASHEPQKNGMRKQSLSVSQHGDVATERSSSTTVKTNAVYDDPMSLLTCYWQTNSKCIFPIEKPSAGSREVKPPTYKRREVIQGSDP